ncbi:MAG: hypothetical protein K1V76_00325 [Candidatus Amulumruptor sp.]
MSAAVGGAQLIRGLCASYGGIAWKGMVSPWSYMLTSVGGLEYKGLQRLS